MSDIGELKRLAEAATPGTWSIEEITGDIRLRSECGHLICVIHWNGNDAAYIAAANPQAILSLIAEVESLRTAKAHTAMQAGIQHMEANTQKSIVQSVLAALDLPPHDWEAESLIVGKFESLRKQL